MSRTSAECEVIRTCLYCGQQILSYSDSFEDDLRKGCFFHQNCYPQWKVSDPIKTAKGSGKCAYCGLKLTSNSYSVIPVAVPISDIAPYPNTGGQIPHYAIHRACVRTLCAHCKESIVDCEDFMHNEETDEKLHPGCRDAYMLAANGVCWYCNELLEGEIVELSSAPGRMFHTHCVDGYKQTTRPKCAFCKKLIMDENYFKKDSTGDFFHRKCWGDAHDSRRSATRSKNRADSNRAANSQQTANRVESNDDSMSVGPCHQCGDTISDVKYIESNQDGMHIKLHLSCKEGFLKAKHGACAQCRKPLIGKVIQVASAPGKQFHDYCLLKYRESTRPICEVCTHIIMDDRYLSDTKGVKHYHKSCYVKTNDDGSTKKSQPKPQHQTIASR